MILRCLSIRGIFMFTPQKRKVILRCLSIRGIFMFTPQKRKVILRCLSIRGISMLIPQKRKVILWKRKSFWPKFTRAPISNMHIMKWNLEGFKINLIGLSKHLLSKQKLLYIQYFPINQFTWNYESQFQGFFLRRFL